MFPVLITGSSSWNIEEGQNLVESNIGSTNSGCNVSCILRSNSLQYVGPATEEKKVEYIIRRFNPHHILYIEEKSKDWLEVVGLRYMCMFSEGKGGVFNQRNGINKVGGKLGEISH